MHFIKKSNSRYIVNILGLLFVPIIFFGIVLTVTLKSSSGVAVGKIIDVSREGVLFETCEMDLQYGEQSSRIEAFSTPDLIACDELRDMVGKNLKFNYKHRRFLCLACKTNDIILSYEVL